MSAALPILLFEVPGQCESPMPTSTAHSSPPAVLVSTIDVLSAPFPDGERPRLGTFNAQASEALPNIHTTNRTQAHSQQHFNSVVLGSQVNTLSFPLPTRLPVRYQVEYSNF